jgi:hypothetical protein
MGSYLNAYELLSEVRKGINEFSTAYVQGTDTTGAFDNADIMRKINDAQAFLYNSLLNRKPDLFYKSVALTGVASVYTPPADFYRLRRVEDVNGVKLTQINIDNKRRVLDQGTGWFFYQVGRTYTLDRLSASDVLTFFYVSRCRKLDMGMSSGGGALSLTLATSARKEVSYYNGMMIENVTDDWPDTITAYTAARVATITNTGAASKYYGLISELPEDFHDLIGPKALMLMKESHKSLKPPTVTEINNFREAMAEKFLSFFGTGDQDPVELFY